MSQPGASSAPEARILVADDHEASRMLAQAYLVAAGHHVTLVAGGEEAIEAFRRAEFDLVLLDILMPGIDGIQACGVLRGLPRGQETPMIFLTALSDRETIERAASSGIDDLIWKPIQRTELLVRVRALLRTKRLQDEQRRNMRLIQDQHDALVRSQRLKDALAAFVVHDLKSPLATVAASIDAAAMDPGLEPETLECLAGARESVDGMCRMILNLLDISRSEGGELAVARSEIDVGELVEEAAILTRRRADRKNIRVAVERAAGSLRVRVDADLIRRTIMNLLDNALRFSVAGGSIRVVCARSPGEIEIRVCDGGPGVPAEYGDKIFDRFFQVEARSDADAQSNRGLGLTFCRLASEAHGGRIWVEPNTPTGAVFCVRLPDGSAGASAMSGTRDKPEDVELARIAIDAEIADLLPHFFKTLEQDADGIDEALRLGDIEKVRRLGHGLRGSGSSYGFPEITRLGARLEEAAVAREEALIHEIAAALIRYARRVLDEGKAPLR